MYQEFHLRKTFTKAPGTKCFTRILILCTWDVRLFFWFSPLLYFINFCHIDECGQRYMRAGICLPYCPFSPTVAQNRNPELICGPPVHLIRSRWLAVPTEVIRVKQIHRRPDRSLAEPSETAIIANRNPHKHFLFLFLFDLAAKIYESSPKFYLILTQGKLN